MEKNGSQLSGMARAKAIALLMGEWGDDSDAIQGPGVQEITLEIGRVLFLYFRAQRGGSAEGQSDCRMKIKLIFGLELEEGQYLDLKADSGSN